MKGIVEDVEETQTGDRQKLEASETVGAKSKWRNWSRLFHLKGN